jgi:hypothetical protein
MDHAVVRATLINGGQMTAGLTSAALLFFSFSCGKRAFSKRRKITLK